MADYPLFPDSDTHPAEGSGSLGSKAIVLALFVFSFIHVVFLHGEEHLGTVFTFSWDAVSTSNWDSLFTFFLYQPDVALFLYAMVVIVAFGSVLEHRWGTKRFLFFVLTTGLGVGLGHLVVTMGTPEVRVYGTTGLLLGVLLAYMLEFQDFRIQGFLQVPAVCIPLMAITIYLGYFLSGWTAVMPGAEEPVVFSHVSHLAGLPAGYVAYRSGTLYRHLVLWHHTRQIFNELKREAEARERVEELLEKIATDGMEALTWRERRFLKAASKYYAQKDEVKTE